MLALEIHLASVSQISESVDGSIESKNNKPESKLE